MPGNEFGERIHNFFGQEGLPQGQHQSQVVEGSWPDFSNGVLVGNQGQIDLSPLSNLKNYNAQQTVDPERGQSSTAQHGLNFTLQPIRSEFSRSQLQNHQQPANGFMHGNQVFQTMQNEANFLGMNAESGGHRLTSKGVPPDLHKVPMRLEMGESPVNYDFFGSQQQINSQFPDMLQPLPRQQMGFSDMQLLQQQLMIKQMHDYQMQQQFQKQQLEARQLNSFNQAAVHGIRLSNSHSHPLINGVSLHDTSTNTNWQPELMPANTNWLQCGISPVVQGSSSGLMFTPEQGQMNLMSSVPQQSEQSLYGVPVTGARGPQKGFSAMQINKLAHEHVTSSNDPTLPNQHTAFSSQGDKHESDMLHRPSYQEKLLFSQASVQGTNSKFNFENLLQDDSCERNTPVQEKIVEKQESTDPLESSCIRMAENITAPQKVATLDPTEEKILFGSDNLWDAFGNSSNMSSVGNNLASGSDKFGAFPSLQSGSWSALMQSAVAETSSGITGPQEWGSKQQSVWADTNADTRVNSHSSISAQDSGFKASIVQNGRMQSDATQTAVKDFQEKGSRFFDNRLSEKQMAERSQMANINGQKNSCPTREDEGIGDRLGIWKAASNSRSTRAMEHKNLFTHNLQIHRVSSGFTNACAGNDSSTVRDVQGNIQQLLHNNSVDKTFSQRNSRESNQILESSSSDNTGKTVAEINELKNSAMENSDDSFRSNLSPQTSGVGFKESTQENAPYSSILPGGKQMQSGHVGRRPSIPRKFQYHPMGDIDVTDERCREKVMHLPPRFQQVSGGNQGYFGQSKSLGQTTVNRGMEKAHVSQGDLNCTNEASHKGMRQDHSPSTSGSIDRTVDRFNQVKSASSRHTMLELLHKVDQSQDHVLGTSVSGLSEAKTYAETGGQLQHNQSSASQGFSLQLAPPSQPVTLPDNVTFSQSSLQAVNSLNSLHNAFGKGGTSQSRLTPWASNQSFRHQETHEGAFPGSHGQINCTSGFPFSRKFHQNQQTSVAARPPAAKQSVNSAFEESTSQLKERDENGEMAQYKQSAQIPSQLNPTAHNNKGDSPGGFSMPEALSASQPLVASSSSEQSPSSAMMSSSRANVSTVQHHLWSQSSEPHPDIIRSHPWVNNNLEGRFSGLEKTNQTAQNGREGPSAGTHRMNVLELQGKDIAAEYASDAPSEFSKLAQSNLQTLGQSLVPHNLSMEKNSLQPEHMAGNGEDDSTNRAVKRGEDSIIDSQNLAPKGEQQSPSGSEGLLRDGSLNRKESVLPIGQTVSQSFSNKDSLASAGPDHPQISPQMAPSWFSQYGTYKNGLVQPLNDACRSNSSKMAEQSSIIGRFVDSSHSGQASKELDTVDPDQIGKMQHCADAMPGAETISSGSLPIGVTEQLLIVNRPNKRKISMSGLVSWSKEVMQSSKRSQILSGTEVDWARATDRFVEKLDVETELLEDIPPVLRSKRRLMFTTQLIQQLFRPHPARVMSLVASSNYEIVVYTAARAALGDACSSISATSNEIVEPPNDVDPLPEKTKTTEQISDQYVSKAGENFNSKAERLASDFARLEKGPTIPDLRVEIQDLEKFNVINRFAKFHARGPVDGTECSSSTDRAINSLRLYPQRYVTVAPLPRNVPDRVQCLSL